MSRKILASEVTTFDPNVLCKRMLEIGAKIDELQAQYDADKAHLKDYMKEQMGNDPEIMLDTDVAEFTLKWTPKTVFNQTAFKEKHADLFSAFQVSKPELRLTNSKKGETK